MSCSVSEALRRAVKNGLLQVSLHRRWDGKVWCAGYRNTDNLSVQYKEDPDPEKALLAAIRAGTRDVKEAPAKPRRRDIEDLA